MSGKNRLFNVQIGFKHTGLTPYFSNKYVIADTAENARALAYKCGGPAGAEVIDARVIWSAEYLSEPTPAPAPVEQAAPIRTHIADLVTEFNRRVSRLYGIGCVELLSARTENQIAGIMAEAILLAGSMAGLGNTITDCIRIPVNPKESPHVHRIEPAI